MKKLYSLILALILITSSQADEGVVLLHGLCRSSASMEKMEESLTKAGFQVLNVDYPSREAKIKELSETTIGKALKDKKMKKCSKIHFVTHSLGGILVRSYFSRNQNPLLGRVVMLGPPNQGSEVVDKLGSWKAFQKINGPAGNELGTDAKSTPKQLGAVNFELGVIAGDKSINWINSMLIKGPDDGKVSLNSAKAAGMKDYIVIKTAHPFIMKNKAAITNTIAFIKTGSFKN